MNCQIARQTLELAREDAPDAAIVAEARRHVSGCVSCRTAVRHVADLDARIGILCRDVPIPAELKEELLAALTMRSSAVGDDVAGSSVKAAIDVPLGENEPATRMLSARHVPSAASRRRWLGLASWTVASAIAVGVGAWALWPATPSVDLEELTGRMARVGIDPASLTEFTAFDGGLAPQPPETMLTDRLLTRPRRLDRFEAAVYFFKLRGVDGRLAVIPKRFIKGSGLPAATSLLAGMVTYRAGFRTTAWVEGRFVYVCCLNGSEHEFRSLGRPRTPPA